MDNDSTISKEYEYSNMPLTEMTENQIESFFLTIKNKLAFTDSGGLDHLRLQCQSAILVATEHAEISNEQRQQLIQQLFEMASKDFEKKFKNGFEVQNQLGARSGKDHIGHSIHDFLEGLKHD